MNKSCFPYRTALTEHQLLGTPLPADLRRHLGRCQDCSREAAETDGVVRTLHRSGPAPARAFRRGPGPEPLERPSTDLRDRIVRDVTLARPVRPRPVSRAAIGLVAAAVAAVAIVVPMSLEGVQAPATAAPVALTRHGHMIEKPWGTEVPVVLSGLTPGESYRMMAVNAAGKKASGGSVRGEGGAPVSLRMVTAMPRDTITALIVEDDHGHVVTRLAIRPSST